MLRDFVNRRSNLRSLFTRRPVDYARLRRSVPEPRRENCESKSWPRNDVAGSKGTWIPSSLPGTCCLRCTAVDARGVTAAYQPGNVRAFAATR